MITTKIILDSISPHGQRLTTFSLEYPRYVHSELMTHRVFSRNASSTRAIPVKKQIQRIIQNPAIPVHFGANQPGMQANQELTGWRRALARNLWLLARWPAIGFAYLMVAIGLHKQVAGRILEPWTHICVVLSSTEWGNFFNLRYHPMAQPEMQELARKMWEAMEASIPKRLTQNDWHLPFLTQSDIESHDLETLKKISAARCARVSYLNHEGKQPSVKEDLALFERLMGGNPRHCSPAEHQAKPSINPLTGNFKGWRQFRGEIDGENLPTFKGPVK